MIQETSPHGYPAEPWRMGVTVPQQDAKSRTCTRLRTIRVLFAVSGLASGAIRVGRGGYDRGEYLTKVATVQNCSSASRQKPTSPRSPALRLASSRFTRHELTPMAHSSISLRTLPNLSSFGISNCRSVSEDRSWRPTASFPQKDESMLITINNPDEHWIRSL